MILPPIRASKNGETRLDRSRCFLRFISPHSFLSESRHFSCIFDFPTLKRFTSPSVALIVLLGHCETIAHTLPYTSITTSTKRDRDNSPVFLFLLSRSGPPKRGKRETSCEEQGVACKEYLLHN